jgi:hypothetical protein
MFSELDPLPSDPCSFPDFSDELRCGMFYDSMVKRSTFLCDPYSLVSHSEIGVLSKTLKKIRNAKDQHCTCSVSSKTTN